ncbi:Lipopolysaccharide core heptosyltransferase RfaQ [Andreprevotia sp. IGB-42]|uniref:glycosyltransferase family 9 protein n=1 Tax=Andreprevotia sp. IGB-42 TaxID=2497473 RepID=UPI0013596C69|nr:glycosyltransferase family 9 protein [Andreprevotia sp. IGB-42]KAF0812360.1 Lipopolysaccharide core heptosyltransferase RfaQ [Andreprevotia sp. IGB-42]
MNRLLRHILSRPRQAAVFDRAALQRILLLQVDNKIGDLVVATSLLRNLRQGCPGAEVDVLTRPACAAILRGNTAVSQVFDYTKKATTTLALVRRLRARRYDLVITLEEHDSSTTLTLVKLIGARHNLGFFKSHWPMFDLSLQHGAYHGHITDKYRSILTRLGLPADGMDYDFQPAAVDASPLDAGSGPRIVLNCYGSSADKTLAQDAAVALIAALRSRVPACQVFLLDAPGQREQTLQLAAIAGAAPLPAFGSIAEAASHVCKADLLISTDTAWLHIASALQLPVLALYAEARNLHTWAPYRTRHAGLVATGPAREQFDAAQAADIALGLL